MRGFLTFRHIFPVVLFSMLFVLAMRQSARLDPDLWWHLKAGEQIVNTRSIPYTDDFSFTKRGSEWVMHEWLSEVVIFGIDRMGGLVTLVILFSLIIVLALWIAYRRCEGRPYAAAVAILLAAAASSPLFGIRPQMITFLFASIYIALLEGFVQLKESRGLWWLPPMMLLWVNLHAGFALGLTLIGLYIVVAALNRSWSLLRPLAIVLLICLVMVPINPNGLRMFSYPYETLTSPAMAALIEEWASPDFHKSMYLPLAMLLLGTFGVLALSPRRARASELFLLLLTAFGGLRSVRHIPIFALIAAPSLANHLWDLLKARGWDQWFTSVERPVDGIKLVLNLALLVAVGALAFSRVWHFTRNQRTYEAIRNPINAVDFLKSQQLPGPIYNRYGWGGYLIYRLYPDYRVYIDGRADVYGDSFFVEAMNTNDGIGNWRHPLDSYGVNTVLISPDVGLASLLRTDSEWKVVYEDDRAVIFNRASHVRSAYTQTAH